MVKRKVGRPKGSKNKSRFIEEKSKIIRIIYPKENGTLGLFKSMRWDVVTKNCTYYVYNYATIRAINILEDIYRK